MRMGGEERPARQKTTPRMLKCYRFMNETAIDTLRIYSVGVCPIRGIYLTSESGCCYCIIYFILVYKNIADDAAGSRKIFNHPH